MLMSVIVGASVKALTCNKQIYLFSYLDLLCSLVTFHCLRLGKKKNQCHDHNALSECNFYDDNDFLFVFYTINCFAGNASNNSDFFKNSNLFSMVAKTATRNNQPQHRFGSTNCWLWNHAHLI